MSQKDENKSVINFVLVHIDSVEKLEVLLHLYRNADKEWTPKQISEQIRTNENSVAGRLISLKSIGLLESSDDIHFKYNPKTDELKHIVDGLVKFYQERRVSLIELIFSKPSDKVLSFAEAFRFRKDDKS